VEQLVVCRLQQRQSALKKANGRAAARQPDDAGGLTPKRIGIDNPAGFVMIEAVPPLADMHSRLTRRQGAC
jgi:hypothetical protein